MTFQPVVPLSGYAGWKVLQRTEEAQRAAFNASDTMQRDLAYFKDNIKSITSPEQLVADYRMLNVALRAFGLEEDIGNKFFIRKVLEEGSLNPDSLANKLSDSRYLAFTKAFGFGDFDTPNTVLSTFPDEIADKFKDRSFESAVGSLDNGLRLALNTRRELSEIANSSSSDNTKWFQIMGTTALREVMETALGLPSSVGSLDLDRQLDEFRERSERFFGSSAVEVFSDPDVMEKLIQRYLINESIQSGFQSTSPASTAVTLLSAIA